MLGISIPTDGMWSYTTRLLYDPSTPDDPNYRGRERERESNNNIKRKGEGKGTRVCEESARVSEGSMR